MANHTTFKIGGSADIYVQPAKRKELFRVIEECWNNEADFVILGNASNVLVPDEGYRGVIVHLRPYMNTCEIKDNVLKADAGAMLASIAGDALEAGLSGLEFASGIPGTVGGAVCMNAGAYNHDIAEVCSAVDILLPSGKLRSFSNEEMDFGYRDSVINRNEGFVIGASFKLTPGRRQDISEYMRDLNGRRRQSQPLEYPSVGSIFKRPKGHYTGKLIEDCNLKGYSIGGAQVSEKHAGFIVNTGEATSQDVLDLIEHITTEVWNKFAVMLEPEVKILCNL